MARIKVKITAIVSQPYSENTYIANLEGRQDCLVVDAGLEPEKILRHLEEKDLTPAAILITHGHPDHVGGNAAMKKKWPDCPIVGSAAETPVLSQFTQTFATLMGGGGKPPPVDVRISDGESYSAAGFDLVVREIPGHAPDHIVFIWSAGKPTYVFAGDVLFRGSVGRTDFPGCSFEQLRDGIHSKLFVLPDDTVVLPGHGSPTTVGEEKRTNPFVGAPTGYRE